MKNSNRYNIFIIIGCMIGIVGIISVEANIENQKRISEADTKIRWETDQSIVVSSDVELESQDGQSIINSEGIEITDELNELAVKLVHDSSGYASVLHQSDRISLLTMQNLFLDKPVEYIEKVINDRPFLEIEEYIQDDIRECIMEKVNSLWNEDEGDLYEIVGKDKDAIVKVSKKVIGENKPDYEIEVEIVGYKFDEAYYEEIDKMLRGIGYVPDEILTIGRAKNIRYDDYIALTNKYSQYNDKKTSNGLDINVCVVGNEIDTVSVVRGIYTGQFPAAHGCNTLDLNMADEFNTLEDYQREMLLRIGAMLGINNLDREIEKVIKEGRPLVALALLLTTF